MKHNMIVEICCGSLDDVIEAKKAGAVRVEYNSAMALGGFTPSIGQMKLARELDLSLMVMVRPREGGFCYTDAEYRTMLSDAAALIEAGADGIVFGFLQQDGTLDVNRCRQMMQIIGDKQSVFHRAIDVVPDWKTTLAQLIDLGVTRVLTSGQQSTALDGADTIRQMIHDAAGRIEILPGGGIRPHNVATLIAQTGCTQLHASSTKICTDCSTQHNPAIRFGASTVLPETQYKMTDVAAVTELFKNSQQKSN